MPAAKVLKSGGLKHSTIILKGGIVEKRFRTTVLKTDQIAVNTLIILSGKFLLVSSCPESVRLLTEFYLRVNVAFAPLEAHQTWYFH